MMKYSQELHDLLSRNSLFNSLNASDYQDLAKILTQETFQEGENIVKEGELPDKIYVILSGSASVIKTLSDNAEFFEHEVAVLKPGDSIGDVSLIDRQPRSATVRALEKTVTISFLIDQLSSLSPREDSIESKLKINFAVKMSQYLRNANNNTLSERKRHQSEITQLTNFDVVTGLPNQYLFRQKLSEQLAEYADDVIALIQVEIVDFKEVCDALGNEVGEQFLTAASDRLTTSTANMHLIARVGFNQFMIMCTKLPDLSAVPLLVTRIIHLFSSPFMINDDNIFTNIYVGIAHYPDDGIQPDILIKRAGLALDAAKLNEPNSYAFYNKEMDKLVENRRKLIHELHEAFDGDQFELYYQPQVDLKSNKLIGAEALIRWIHPNDGMIAPAVFIPIVEQTGLILKLGIWIFRMACAQAKMWRDSGNPLRIAVNLSALQFMQKDLIKTFKQIIEETEISPSLIELEITESIMMSDSQETIAKINQFVEMGFIIAIDDFGTGYSSLSSLSKLPIHKLKIDQSFINEMMTSENNKAIVECIIAMAKGLRLIVIAEGVENHDQAAILSELACDEGQGYLFSKPITASEFEHLYFTLKSPGGT